MKKLPMTHDPRLTPHTVEVIVPGALEHGFDYLVPENMQVEAGSVVTVPLSRRHVIGVVWGKGRGGVAAEKLKAISVHHDAFPPLSEAFRQFLSWVAWYNGTPLGAVLKMVLPIKDMDKEGRLDYMASLTSEMAPHIPHLSDYQQEAAATMVAKLHQGFSVTLLDGVTGSGKTEVYFDVMARLLKERGSGNNQILVLLPEIALSVQWLARFEKRFGVKPVLWHSHVTPARRREAFKAIASGDARVIVGARSALFLPYKHLSLVVVDEEHDSSYKQEDGVMYHARDMAIARARHEKFPVVLVSATPSLESVHNMQMGKYQEVTLPLRHAGANLPDIHLVDMREQVLERDNFVSPLLREAMAEALARGHQSMLFLNRRGYAPLVLCRHCGHRFECPNCSAWLVMHQKKNTRQGGRVSHQQASGGEQEASTGSLSKLRCHHCDYHIAMPSTCPECQSEESLHACGPGVERIVEEVRAFLPQAKVATLASDSTTNPQELHDTIHAMQEGNIDVLVGTQMLAKGHHFGGLAVVGVVDADLGLAGGDLRAAEKTYQLLHQVAGRAGREEVRGHVYLQSYIPEHPVMQALASGGRDAFFAAELMAREVAKMPPYHRLAALIIEGSKESDVTATCQQLARHIQREARIAIYGPAPAPLSLLRGNIRYRFLVNATRNINLPDYMKKWVNSANIPNSVRVKIDIDPVSFM